MTRKHQDMYKLNLQLQQKIQYIETLFEKKTICQGREEAKKRQKKECCIDSYKGNDRRILFFLYLIYC